MVSEMVLKLKELLYKILMKFLVNLMSLNTAKDIRDKLRKVFEQKSSDSIYLLQLKFLDTLKMISQFTYQKLRDFVIS